MKHSYYHSALNFSQPRFLKKAAKAADSVSSQARYHTALRKIHDGRIELIEGYYSLIESKAKIIDADDPNKWPRNCQSISVWTLEEKQSDVNLALQAYHDVITKQVDHVIIVNNDTDIAPALKMIRIHTAATIGLVIPTRDHQRVPNTELANLAHWVRTHITKSELISYVNKLVEVTNVTFFLRVILI